MSRSRLTRARTLVAAALVSGMLAGCGGADDEPEQTGPTPSTDSSRVSQAGASQEDAQVQSQVFRGTLPCASCEGIETELTLRFTGDEQPSGFSLKETYKGTDEGTQVELSEGQWTQVTGTSADQNAVVYQLDPQGEHQRFFQRIDENTLRMLDLSMEPIDSALDYELTRE